MRVLFVPMAWHSHYYPMVPTGWALEAAGHEVRVAAQPALVEQVKTSGLTPVPVGRDYDFIGAGAELQRQARERLRAGGGALNLDSARSLPPELKRRLDDMRFQPHRQLLDATVDDLVALVRGWQPDLIVADPFVYAAPLAAQLCGVRLVRHMWGPDFSWHLGFFPGLGSPGAGSGRESWPALLLEAYERFGVEVRDDFATHTIDPCPTRLQSGLIPNRVPLRFVPYNGPGVAPVPVPASKGRPRVCVTWGVGTNHVLGSGGFPLPAILAALSTLDVEVLLGIKGSVGDSLGELPDGVRVTRDVPLHLLLADCSAVIHQGGAGSLLNSIAAGLPQLVIAQILDQVYNGDRLASTGAGITLRAADADTDAIKSAMSTLLSGDEYPAAAAALRADGNAQSTPAEVAEFLVREV